MYENLLFANLVLWLALMVYYVRQQCASAYHPATYYLFFHGLVFVVRPFLAWYRDYNLIYTAYQFTPSLDDKITVLIAAMLGLISFMLAAMRSGNAPPRFVKDLCTESERSNLIKPFLIVAVVLVPFGLISALQNWSDRAADTTTMIFDASTGNTVNTTGNGYFDNLQLLLAPLSVLFVWLFRFRWWSFVPLVAFVVLRSGTGGRWPFVMACATSALLFLYERRRRWPDMRSVIIGIATLALFQAVGEDRGSAVRKLFIEDRARISYSVSDLRYLEGMDFANLEFFEYLVYVVPQRSGTYGFFLDNLQILTQPVPRAIWPKKPVGPPIKLFSLFDYGYPIGMTNSLPGEGWVQLGYVGVVVWCGLFGWLFGWAYNRFERSTHGNPAVLYYLLFLPLSLTFFRDGLLLTLTQTALFVLLPVWLIVRLARLLGLPFADDLRMALVRRLTCRAGTGTASLTVERAWATLPAAVRRRRAALQASAANTEA